MCKLTIVRGVGPTGILCWLDGEDVNSDLKYDPILKSALKGDVVKLRMLERNSKGLRYLSHDGQSVASREITAEVVEVLTWQKQS